MNTRDEINAIPNVDATNESSLSRPRSLSNTRKAGPDSPCNTRGYRVFVEDLYNSDSRHTSSFSSYVRASVKRSVSVVMVEGHHHAGMVLLEEDEKAWNEDGPDAFVCCSHLQAAQQVGAETS